MQQWEYLIVKTEYSSSGLTGQPKWEVYWVNGQELKRPRPLVWEYLNQLGREGWEMVNATSETQYGRPYFALRRLLIREG